MGPQGFFGGQINQFTAWFCRSRSELYKRLCFTSANLLWVCSAIGSWDQNFAHRDRLNVTVATSQISIQIIEANPHLRSLLGWHLQQAGYEVFLSGDFAQAKELYYHRRPAFVVLSTDIVGPEGLEFCRWLRQQSSQGLILMLSSRSTETEIVEGLRAGADDYLKKPFGMQEFLARVESIARRLRAAAPPSQLDYGLLKIDLVHRRVRYGDDRIELTPQEFSLLYVLAQAEGNPLSRAELLQRAWPAEIDNPRTVDTHILSLRKKVEPDPQQPNLIQTVRNVGYRLNLEGLIDGSAQPRAPKPTGPKALGDRPPSDTFRLSAATL
jgi:two-component system, OmpR family, response regulator